jgi:phage tail tape-measure protein
VIESYAKAAYNNLDDAAKKKGAEYLNKTLKLDPPLDEDASWEDISKVAGAAAGGAIGGAIGGPLGAKLGAIVGAYLGVKLEELVSKHIEELKAWLSDKWGDIEGAVKDAANYVEDKAEEAYDDVVDFVGGLF